MSFTKEELFELTTESGGHFKVEGLQKAFSFCKTLAISHYENFPVASILLPKDKRDYIYSVYAFARIADDIADELCTLPVEERLSGLSSMESNLFDNNFSIKKSGNPVFIALHQTIRKFNIPIECLQKLIIAFKRDVCFVQPENWAEVEDYCAHSANPIGELVLRIFEEYNAQTAKFSAQICTGLQLVNFWQDLSKDIQKERIYIPKKILKKHELEIENLHSDKNSIILDICLKEIYDYTEKYFLEGTELTKLIKNRRLKLEISATVEGGMIILEKLRSLGKNVFFTRPKLFPKDIIKLILRIL